MLQRLDSALRDSPSAQHTLHINLDHSITEKRDCIRLESLYSISHQREWILRVGAVAQWAISPACVWHGSQLCWCRERLPGLLRWRVAALGFQHAQMRSRQGETDAETARQAQELTAQLEKSRGTAASLRSTNEDLSKQLDKQTATGLDLKTANSDLTKRLEQLDSELNESRQSEAKQSELQTQLLSSQLTLQVRRPP